MSKSRKTFSLVIIAIIFIVGLWVGNRLPGFFGFGGSRQIYNSATMLDKVQTLSQLVTVQYNTTTLVTLEDVKWYGDNRVILQASGIVKAGIDLARMRTNDIAVKDGGVYFQLPPAQITDAYLDDAQTKVIDQTTGFWRAPDPNLQQLTRSNAVDTIRRDARNRGILKDADERARLQLAALCNQLGFTNVVFGLPASLPMIKPPG